MDAAAETLLDVIEEIAAGVRPLVVGDATGRVAAALALRGSAPTTWRRRAADGAKAQAWPPAGPFTSAFVRLPKEKAALDMALHAVAAGTAPGSAIVVFGANAEGIKSAAAHLDVVADGVAAIATRRHCRVIAGARRPLIADLKDSLAAWRTAGEIRLPGGARPWVAYPGVFAGGALDAGTALLIGHLPRLGAGARVLDFAGGTGVVAAALLQSAPDAVVDLVEIDALALEAARENVPRARLFLGDALAAAGATRYDAIVSNPPIHDGVAEDHGVLQRLVAGAPAHLAPGGELRIVVQRRVPASKQMQAAFGNVTVIAETGQFRVLGSSVSR